MVQAKRVILRVREADLDFLDIYEPVRLHLQHNDRSVSELEEDRHFIHIQPPNPDIPQTDPKIHIIIDLEKDSFSGGLDGDFPHELYRMRRVDDKLRICVYQDGPWYRNFVSKIRTFTDDLYPWGCTSHDLRNSSRAAFPT
ncbi:hypothetical protein BDW59DRAFT_60437 [Aspergillus cavernicola]|uniref:Uncharacterized protein n=1 Tax=Aspergillus cavernicola TaxID=176166 RepID=A0ABR4H6X5_9EURO